MLCLKSSVINFPTTPIQDISCFCPGRFMFVIIRVYRFDLLVRVSFVSTVYLGSRLLFRVSFFHSSSLYHSLCLLVCIICLRDTWWCPLLKFVRFPVHHSFILTSLPPDSRHFLFWCKQTHFQKLPRSYRSGDWRQFFIKNKLSRQIMNHWQPWKVSIVYSHNTRYMNSMVSLYSKRVHKL